MKLRYGRKRKERTIEGFDGPTKTLFGVTHLQEGNVSAAVSHKSNLLSPQTSLLKRLNKQLRPCLCKLTTRRFIIARLSSWL